MRKLLIIKLLIFIFNILLCASLSLPPSSSASLTSHNTLSDLILNREKRYKRDITYCNGLSQPNYLTTILQKPYENDEASFWEKYMNFLPTPNNWVPTLTRAIYDANPNHNCNPPPTATVQYINAPSSSSSGSVSTSPLTPLSPPLSTVTTTTTTTTTTAANRHHPRSSQIGMNLNYNALHHQPPTNDGILRIINNLPVVNNDEADIVGDGFVSGTTNLNIPLIPLKTNYYDTDFHKISDDDPAFKEALKLAKALSNTDIFEKSNQLPTCLCGNKNIPNKCTKCLFQKQIKSKRNDNENKANYNTNCIQKDTTVPGEKDECKKFQSKFHYKPNEYEMNGFYESVQKLVHLFSEEKLKELHKKSEEQRQKVLKKQEEDDNSKIQLEKSSQNNDLDDQSVSETTIFHEEQQNMIGDQETQEDKPPTDEERIKEQIIEKEQTENIANDEVKISENPIIDSKSQENVPESTIEKPIMTNESENDQTIIESEKGNVNDESSGNLEIENDEMFSEISPEKEENDKTNIEHYSGIVSNVQEIEENKMNEDDNLEHKDLTQDESAIQSVQIEKSKSSEIFMKSEQNERSINNEMTQTTEINEDQHFANTETAEEKIDLLRSDQETADDVNEDKSNRNILSQILPESSDDDNTVRVNEEIETLQSSQKSRESENENKLAEENLLGQLFSAVGDRDDDEKIQDTLVNLNDKSETSSSTPNSNVIEDEISLLGILPTTDENTDENTETQKSSAEKTDNNKFSETQMQSENSGDVIDDEVELLPTSEKYEENQSDTEAAESDFLEKVVEFSDGTLIDRGSESALNRNQNTESREVELLPNSENEKNLEIDSKSTENAVNMENRSENEMNLLQNSENEFQEDDGTREINEVEAHKSIEPSGHSLIFHEGLDENESEKSDQNIVQNNEKSSTNPDEFANKNEPVVLDSILLENRNPTLEDHNPTEIDSEHQSAEFFPSIVTIPDQSQEQPIPLNLGTETGTITKYTYQIVPDSDVEGSKIISPEENIIDNTEMQNMDENLHPVLENEPQTFVENSSNTENEKEETLEFLPNISEHLVTSESQHLGSNTAEVEKDETTPELLPNNFDLVTSEAQHFDSNTAEVEKENETTPELLPNNSDLVTSEAQHSDSNTAEFEKENEATPELLPDNSDLVTSEAQHSDNNTAGIEKDETTPELLPNNFDLVTSEAQHFDSNTAEVEKKNETTPELLPDNFDLVTSEAQHLDSNIEGIEKNETTPELLPDNFDLVTSEAQHLDSNIEGIEKNETTPELLPINSEHLETSESQHHYFIDASSSDNSQTKSENHSYNSVINAQSISTLEQEPEIPLTLLNSVLDVVDFLDSEKTDNVPSELLASNQNSDTVTNSDTLKDNNNGGQTAESIDLKHEINSTQELEGSASNVYDVVSSPQPLSPSHVDDNVLPQPSISQSVSINSLPALISLPGVALYFNRMLVEDKVPTIGMSLHVNKAVIKHLPCGQQLDNQQKEESENIPVTIPYEESENDVPEHNDEEDDSNSEHESSCPGDSEMEPDSQYATDFSSQTTGPAENKNEDLSPTELSKLPLLDETLGNNSAEKDNTPEDSYTKLNMNPHENDVVYNSRPVLISYPTAVTLSQPSNVDIKPNTESYTLSPLTDPIQNGENVEVDVATNILQHQPVPVHDHDNISEEDSHPLHPNEVQYQPHTLPVAHYDDHHDHGVEIKQASTYNENAKLDPSNELLAESENYLNEQILEPTQESHNQLQFTNPIEPHFYHIPRGEKLVITENPSRSDQQSENMNLSSEHISPPTPKQENIQPLTVENISPLMINVLPKISVPVTPPHDIRMQNEIEPPPFIPKYNPLFSKHKLKLLLGEALNKKMSQKLPKYATKLLSFHDLDMQGSEIYSKLENLKASKILETPEQVVYSGNNQKIDSPTKEEKITNEHSIQEVSNINLLVNPNGKMVFEPKTKPITTPSTICLDEHQSTELETAASHQSNVVVKSPNSIVSTDQENKENSRIEKSNSKKSDSKMPELLKSHITTVNQAHHPDSQHRTMTMTPPGVQLKSSFKTVTLSTSENEKYHRPNEKFKNPSENKATSMIDNLKAEIQEDNAQPTSLNEMNSEGVEKKLSKSELYNELNESKVSEMDDSRTSTDKFALELYTVLDEIVDKYLQTRLGDELNVKHDEMKLNDSFSKSIQNQFSSKKFKRENKGVDNRKDKLQTSASNIVTKYVLAPSSVIEMNGHHHQISDYMISPTIATSQNHQYDTKVLPEQSFLSKLLKKILSESENKKISQLAQNDEKLLSTVSDVFAEEIQNKLNPNEFNNFLDEFSSLNKIPKQFSESTPELSELETPPVNGEHFFNLRNDNFEGQATTTNDELSSFEQSNVPENLKKVTFHMNSDQISEEQSDDVSTEKNQKMLNKKPNRHDHHYEDNECCSSELHQFELNPSPAPLPRTSHSLDYPFETDEPHPLNIRPSLPTFLTRNGCSHLKISNSIQNNDQKKDEHETKDTNPFISLRSQPSLQSPLSINDHQDPIDIYRNRRQQIKPWFEEYETPPTPYTPSESSYNSVESSSSHRVLTKRSIKDQNFKRSTILNDKKDKNVVIRNPDEQNQFWKSLLKGMEQEFTLKDLIQNKNNKKKVKTENQQKILSKKFVKKSHNNNQKKKNNKENSKKDSKYSCETEVLNIEPIIEHDNAHLINDSSRSSKENGSQQVPKLSSVSKQNLSNSDDSSTNLSNGNTTSEEFIESDSIEVE